MHNDVDLAKKYITKSDNTKTRGIDFNLSFNDYKNLMKKKRCEYTGIIFSLYKNGKPINKFHGRTIDRIDSSIGYTKDNCVVCITGANSFKGLIEDKSNKYDFNFVIKVLNGINKVKENKENNEKSKQETAQKSKKIQKRIRKE